MAPVLRSCLTNTSTSRCTILPARYEAAAFASWKALVFVCMGYLGDASRFSSTPTVGQAIFVYDYTNRGQDWSMQQCASRARQSPIDLPHIVPPPTSAFWFRYNLVSSPVELKNNGRIYSLNLNDLGYGGIAHADAWYDLVSVHIHAASEHTVGGQHRPVEMQLVHKITDGDALLIVAVTIVSPNMPVLALMHENSLRGAERTQKSIFSSAPSPSAAPPGATYMPPLANEQGFNAAVQPFLLTALPPPNGVSNIPLDEQSPLDLNVFLHGGSFFEYSGSLTAPPCAETVTWLVRADPLGASNSQIQSLLDGVFGMTAGNGNYRSTMPLNGRRLRVRSAVFGRPPLMSVPTIPYTPPDPAAVKASEELQAMERAEIAYVLARNVTKEMKAIDLRLHGPPSAVSGLAPAPALALQDFTTDAKVQAFVASVETAAAQAVAKASEEMAAKAHAAAQKASRVAVDSVIEAMPQLTSSAPTPCDLVTR
eukprot:TRINITY_DN38665_c0_g1_i1.p1 TRINITY_DN38665_c0_g1~~TRINITY_DN38665_c0_g1_i1.p1  ORF type:complete len:504 (+),score=70.82 TRINITY_DN38665_c0_g1_i1:67-1512(+)